MIAFSVEGTPAPQGSKTPTRYGFRESSKRVKPWREAVRLAAIVAGDEAGLFDTLEPPYRVDVWFYIARPRTTKADYPVAPTVGDLDKLLRSTLDALKAGGLLEDDRFVVKAFATKQWAGVDDSPGAVIRVMEVRND